MGLWADLFDFRRPNTNVIAPRNMLAPPTISFDGGLMSDVPVNGSGGITRYEALALPGVAKAHHVLVAWASSLNLRAYDEADVEKAATDPEFVPKPIADQPVFLTDRTGDFSPEMRMWRLMDDLYFHGRSFWYTRARGGIRAKAAPVPISEWELQCDDATGLHTATMNNGAPVTRQNSVLFKVPGWDGLLYQAARTLIGARATELAWVERMLSPIQLVEFAISEDATLTQEELDAWINAWKARRRDGGQAVGATPPDLTMKVHSGALGELDLFLTQRNVMRNDIASHSSLDGSVADGSGGQDSLTYQTQVGIRDGFYEFDSAFWLNVITSTLSQAPVTPEGVVVRPMYLPILAPTGGSTPGERRSTQTKTEPDTTVPPQNRRR